MGRRHPPPPQQRGGHSPEADRCNPFARVADAMSDHGSEQTNRADAQREAKQSASECERGVAASRLLGNKDASRAMGCVSEVVEI